MRKRIISGFIIASLLCVGLAGCSSANPQSGPINQREDEETATVAESGPEAVPETEGNAEDNGESNGEALPESETDNLQEESDAEDMYSDRYILAASSSDKVFIVDKSGKKIEEYSISEISKAAYDGQERSLQMLEYYNGSLIFRVYVNQTDYWTWDIIAYDTVSGKTSLVYQLAGGEYIQSADVYNGKLYLSIYDYNGKDSSLRVSEKVFKKDRASSQIVQEDNPYIKLFEDNYGLNFETNKDKSAEYLFFDCFTENLEEYGFILASKDSDIIKVDSDGKQNRLPIEQDGYKTVWGYDADYCFYSRMDEELDADLMYVYSFEDGSVKSIPELANGSFLLYDDGNVYYYRDISTEYGIKNNYIYRYDVASGETAFIYETRSVPGYSASDMPGVTGFTVINGEIYFQYVMDRAVKWVRVNFDESGASYTDIYCEEADINALKYGDVDYISASYDCPLCGTRLYSAYSETFKLSPEYSAFSDKINADIAEKNDVDGEYEPYEPDQETCAEHIESPFMYNETEEYTVRDVRLIGDHYISVDMSGYYYSGGIHGMPYMDYLFYDLNTGEEMELEDFYSGTEEDFKELVTSIADRDYDNGAEYISLTYEPENKESVLNSIRDCTGFEMNIKFEEEGIEVEFPPYSIGPYSSGFIDIFVSYSELLGRDRL
ncbi:MAG: hypothetical protein IJ796_09010 [Lachnospiraceae bacterium]|nr:hypothetical protein [Lachnospiraceae bacterium]